MVRRESVVGAVRVVERRCARRGRMAGGGRRGRRRRRSVLVRVRTVIELGRRLGGRAQGKVGVSRAYGIMATTVFLVVLRSLQDGGPEARIHVVDRRPEP